MSKLQRVIVGMDPYKGETEEQRIKRRIRTLDDMARWNFIRMRRGPRADY
ncbi:MAG: hypothetical protein ACFB50_09700 [Rubrobacteraceae bacterium]